MADEAQPAPAKSRLRSILMVVVILVVEAAAIVGIMMLTGSPPEVHADLGAAEAAVAEEEKIVEMLVLDAKLPNNKSGFTYIYDTEIFVQVKQKHVERVTSELDQFQNEIKAELTAIWRTSDPSQFEEPRLETLTRKVHALLSQRFGVDLDDEPIATKCVIVMGTGFRVD